MAWPLATSLAADEGAQAESPVELSSGPKDFFRPWVVWPRQAVGSDAGAIYISYYGQMTASPGMTKER